MSLTVLNPPLAEPLTLAELKEFLRVDPGDTSQDTTLMALNSQARTWVETKTRRKLVQQTLRLQRDFFPGYYAVLSGQPGSSPVLSGPALLAGIRYAVVLDHPPVQAMVNFQYQNANGDVTVLNPATDYLQDLASNPARLTPPFGQMWPVARVVLNAVEIDYTVGYAIPITVDPGSFADQISAENYIFVATDIGRPISIPGAGPNGQTLNTIIAGIASPPSGMAAIRDPYSSGFTAATALLVNAANGNPAHWEQAKIGIRIAAEGIWRRIAPSVWEAQASRVVYSMSDLRL